MTDHSPRSHRNPHFATIGSDDTDAIRRMEMISDLIGAAWEECSDCLIESARLVAAEPDLVLDLQRICASAGGSQVRPATGEAEDELERIKATDEVTLRHVVVSGAKIFTQRIKLINDVMRIFEPPGPRPVRKPPRVPRPGQRQRGA